MPTYVYETIPLNADEAPVRFEVKQSMNAPKLTEHPDSGTPVRRLISSGFAIFKKERQSIGSVTDPSWSLKD
ncbi:MAG: FmdB family zinc ribbon protein [Roseibacillus sp.]